MAVTTSSDLHSINQLAEDAIEIAFAATPLLSIPGITADLRGRIQDAGGDYIDFSTWRTDTTGMVQNAVRNSRVGVTPSKLTLTSYSETAVSKTISIDTDKYAFEDASADANAHMQRVIGNEFAKEIQASLITKAAATDQTYTTAAGGLTVDEILQARLAWGEYASQMGQTYLFTSTAAATELMMSTDYKTMVGAGANNIAGTDSSWRDNIVATVHGVGVVLLDSLPANTAYLVGQNAFGVYVHDRPVVTEIPHAGSLVRTYDAHFRYASTLLRHDPRHVVAITVTA